MHLFPTRSSYWSCIMHPPSQALLFDRSNAFSYSFFVTESFVTVFSSFQIVFWHIHGIRWPTLSLSTMFCPRDTLKKRCPVNLSALEGEDTVLALSPSSCSVDDVNYARPRSVLWRHESGGKFRLSHLSMKIFAHSSCCDVIPNIWVMLPKSSGQPLLAWCGVHATSSPIDSKTW